MIHKLLFLIIIIAVLAAGWLGGSYLFSQKNPDSQPTPTSIITQALTPTLTQTPIVSTLILTTTLTITPTPTAVNQNPAIPAGWQTYTNTQNGFTISYPPPYKTLTNKDNLYGWPNLEINS